MTRPSNVLGMILAGGLARRMGGGDKSLIELNGKPLLAHVIDRLKSQTDHLILNANGEAARFAEYHLPVVPDPIDGAQGPLAGVLAGLDWAQANTPQCDWMVSVASDTPFFPEDLIDKMMAAVGASGADMACAASNAREHPVFGLWPVKLAGDLRIALIDENIRKVDVWTGRYKCEVVDFEAETFDPFFNVNRPEDIEQARMIAQRVLS